MPQHRELAPKPPVQSVKSPSFGSFIKRHWALVGALGGVLLVIIGVLTNVSGSMYFLTGRPTLCDIHHFGWCPNLTTTAAATPISTLRPTATVGPTATTSSSPTAPTSSVVGTHSEQEGNLGADTFTDYHSASGKGAKIGAWQWVQVSCKVYDPTIPSVYPDGYWYRIASTPWNNTYYSAANTFMNGGALSGPGVINTDLNVPDC